MIAVVQRVSEARVHVAGEVVGEIANGIVALTSVQRDDTDPEIDRFAERLVRLRIFRNDEKHFDLDVTQVGGAILLVSNFTVAADTTGGRRPSLINAAGPDIAAAKFGRLVQAVRGLGVTVATGQFGADMKVELINDGPATFILSTT